LKALYKLCVFLIRPKESIVICYVVVATQPDQILWMIIFTLRYWINVRRLTFVTMRIADRTLSVRLGSYFLAYSCRDRRPFTNFVGPRELEPFIKRANLRLGKKEDVVDGLRKAEFAIDSLLWSIAGS